MNVLQPYCNRDGTVRYAADKANVRCRQKCCKTTDLPNVPVRNVMGDVELTRRRTLVRTQHRPLRKSSILQVKRRTSKRTQGYACRPSYCNRTATRAEPAHQTVPHAPSIASVAESCMPGRTATGRGDTAGTCQEQLRKGYFVSVVALSCSL
jgi:hypothetical protein